VTEHLAVNIQRACYRMPTAMWVWNTTDTNKTTTTLQQK